MMKEFCLDKDMSAGQVDAFDNELLTNMKVANNEIMDPNEEQHYLKMLRKYRKRKEGIFDLGQPSDDEKESAEQSS